MYPFQCGVLGELILGIFMLVVVSARYCDAGPGKNTSLNLVMGTVPVGEQCNDHQDCADYPEKTLCSMHFCWCNHNYVVVGDNDGGNENLSCEPIRNHIGEECVDPTQCTEGVPGDLSDCLPKEEAPWERACLCKPEAVKGDSDEVCYRKAEKIGDECKTNSQCRDGGVGQESECVKIGGVGDGTCECRLGYGVPDGENRKCLPIRNQLYLTCDVKEQCTHGVPGSWSECKTTEHFPNSTVCVCMDEAVNEIGEDICRKKALSVGDPCFRGAQCKANLGDLSECLAGEVCICTPSYGVPSLIGDKCLPVVNYLGGECQERQQCTVGTPGEHSDCIDSPLIPDQKICNCSSGADHEPGRHQCIMPVIFIGQPCEYDSQCVGIPGVSSACSVNFGLCQCLGGYIPSRNNDDCLPIRNQIGDDCIESIQCQRGLPGLLSDCLEVTNVCNCTAESIHEPGQNICYRRADFIGGPCQVNVQCQVNLGEYSHCLGEHCECSRNAVPSEDKTRCIPISY